MDPRHAAAGIVFAATFLLLALGRIGGKPAKRGWSAMAGGVATLALLVPSDLGFDVWRLVDWQVIGLLAGLMVLAGLADAVGLFAGLRRHLVHLHPGLALWTALAVVAATSAILLNDAAVVVLVPFFVPMVIALGLPPVPSVTLMAVAANVGSLLTPFGNPQDAVLARTAHLGIVDFLRVQALFVALGMALLGVACWWLSRSCPRVPQPRIEPRSARGRPFLVACILVFLALAAAGPAWLGLGGAACVAAALAYAGLRPWIGRPADRAAIDGLDWNVLLLFVGLYFLTAGMSTWFPSARLNVAHLTTAASAGVATTALSNTVGNVPAILAFLRLDPAWTATHAMFLVSVSTLGGALLLTGSAASLLAADAARKAGIEVRFLPFLRTAVPWVLPVLLIAGWRTF
ncbi:MAG: SLC13 family permease [bacterium]